MINKISLKESICKAKAQFKGFSKKFMRVIINQLLDKQRDEIVGKPRNSHDAEKIRWGTYKRNIQVENNGYLTVKIPRIKDGDKTYSLANPWKRFNKDIVSTVVRYFGDGMSTRKISKNIKRDFDLSISPQGISNVVEDFARQMDDWRNEEIDQEDYAAVVVDGLYVSQREEKKLVGNERS